MLERPDIPDEVITSRLQEQYNLEVTSLSFLPIGADLRTAVYRVITDDGRDYFLKLRKNFQEVIVLVPLMLGSLGIRSILVPFETQSGQHWADLGEYKLILYPFIQGQDGFERQMTDAQRRTLGEAFRGIHSTKVPDELKNRLRKETFSAEWRDEMRSFLEQVNDKTFADPTARKLAEYIQRQHNEIRRVLERTEQLALQIQSHPFELVLCHSDIHGGNILISDTDDLYIVDWDDPILAPRERDLMFIGGGIDDLWKSEKEIDLFYQGYGKTEMDLPALAYYRYERVIEDLAVICEQLLFTDKSGADGQRAYGWFVSNFEPGNTIEIADQTYSLFS